VNDAGQSATREGRVDAFLNALASPCGRFAKCGVMQVWENKAERFNT
jgi:hypothetical protein